LLGGAPRWNLASDTDCTEDGPQLGLNPRAVARLGVRFVYFPRKDKQKIGSVRFW
jgi:hypothetical protein